MVTWVLLFPDGIDGTWDCVLLLEVGSVISVSSFMIWEYLENDLDETNFCH